MATEQRVYLAPLPGEKSSELDVRHPNYRVRLLSAVNAMPPLPQALSRLLGMLNSDSASSHEVAAVIEGDSVLSGSVMRCVNSAYYGMPRRVSSIRHAVTLLGFQTVRNLALAFSMRRMMTGNAASRKLYHSYSRHALATAMLTQVMAARTSACEMETAFAAGLFHDVGKLLIYTAAPEVVPAILHRWESSEAPYEQAEQDVVETTHSELSAIVLEGWKLPAAICDAARYHHAPENLPTRSGHGPSLAALVQAADLIVNLGGLRSPETDKRTPEHPAAALESLGLADQPEDLLESFRGEFDNLETLFS